MDTIEETTSLVYLGVANGYCLCYDVSFYWYPSSASSLLKKSTVIVSEP